MAVQAAVGGLGVAIADLHLVKDELAAGLLQAPLDLVIEDDAGYFFLCPRVRSAEPAIAAFRDWLIGEARADEQDFTSRRSARIPAAPVAV
jgi:LysR family transcriptional regulator, glycine cleavage system transcriptional activator